MNHKSNSLHLYTGFCLYDLFNLACTHWDVNQIKTSTNEGVAWATFTVISHNDANLFNVLRYKKIWEIFLRTAAYTWMWLERWKCWYFDSLVAWKLTRIPTQYIKCFLFLLINVQVFKVERNWGENETIEIPG